MAEAISVVLCLNLAEGLSVFQAGPSARMSDRCLSALSPPVSLCLSGLC